jgi:hypothetical protein
MLSLAQPQNPDPSLVVFDDRFYNRQSQASPWRLLFVVAR